MKFIALDRGQDKWGSGDFGAPRGKKTHRGKDYVFGVLSPIKGIVTRLGIAYFNWHYRYVEITDAQGYRHRLFYIIPTVKKDVFVNKAAVIGIHQGLTEKYKGIQTHIHYEIIAPDGTYIDPEVFHANLSD